MTNRARRQLVLLTAALLLSVLAVSCGYRDDSYTVYSHFEKIGPDGWDPADIISFEPWPLDSAEAATSVYRMELVLRYSTRNSLDNLPLAVSIEDENGISHSDTIMAGSGGKRKSAPEVTVRQQYGVREVTLPLQSEVRLTDGYAVNISPLIERSRTKGLLNVGIRLERKK